MTRRTTTALAVLPAAALGALALAAGASGGAHAAATTTRHLSAASNGDLKFTKSKLRAPRGRIVLVMKNPASSGVSHGIAIKSRKGKIVDPGGTSRVSIRLRPGRYTYYCPVSGHRALGMKGRLTVTR